MQSRPERTSEPGSPDLVFLDESRMRVLIVADRPRLVAGVRAVLEKSSRCLFDLDHALDLTQAAARIRGPVFELLLIDLGLGGVRRSDVVDVANELATRIPVVALSGTESLFPSAPSAPSLPSTRSPRSDEPVPHERLEAADLPALILRTRRRACRLGAVALAPVFCRLDHPGA